MKYFEKNELLHKMMRRLAEEPSSTYLEDRVPEQLAELHRASIYGFALLFFVFANTLIGVLVLINRFFGRER